MAYWAVNERLNHTQYILLLKAEKEHSFETFPSEEMKLLKCWCLKGSPLGKMTVYRTLNSSPSAQFAGHFFLMLVLFLGLIHILGNVFPDFLEGPFKDMLPPPPPCLRGPYPEGAGVALSPWAVCRALGSLGPAV